MANIIDRRKNGKGKSASNRQKFVKRVKAHVREGVKKAIREGNITDIVNGKGKKINVPVKDLTQPDFHHGEGGIVDRVLPGNKEFVQGDRLKRPPKGGGGGGGGGEASDSGEGEDSFEFQLTQAEFLDIFFEDLELPDMFKKNISTVEEWTMKRAGFSTDGNPARLNIGRSMRQSKARRKALRSPKKRKLKALVAEQEELESKIKTSQANSIDCTIERNRLVEVLKEIVVLKRKIKAIPFLDDMDLRYNRWEKVAIPTTKAVMFCLMDVSGSMGEWEKEMAKRFFMLLYMFLSRQYEKVDIVFIRHHTVAKEVDEEEFFYSKETGGTIVSSALESMKSIIAERYQPDQWNIYGCQASDGDNWGSDNELVTDLLIRDILPLIQYYAYIETNERERVSDLWPTYESISAKNKNFAMAKITHARDIFPVLRGLFEKQD